MKQHFLVEEDRKGRRPEGVWGRERKKGARKVGCCLLISNTAFSSTQEKKTNQTTKAKILSGQHLIQIQQ